MSKLKNVIEASTYDWNFADQGINDIDGDDTTNYDIPSAQEYKTHTPISIESINRMIESNINEANEEEKLENPPEDPGVEMPEDPGVMTGEEGLKTPKEVGRVYELKKIHSRLIAIESFLSTVSDDKIYQLKNFVSKSIDLFNTLISNVDLFKDKLDDIIILYYKFIKQVYKVIQTHLKKRKGDI